MENDNENVIDKANQAAKRLEEANKVNQELIKRMEAHEARTILGGQTNAGESKVPEITKEEKAKVDRKLYFKGTAIESALK